MEGTNIVPAMDLNHNNNPDAYGWGGGCGMWMWFIIIFALFGGCGFGNRNCGQEITAADVFMNGNATRNEVYNGFNNQTLQNNMQNLQNEVWNGFSNVNTANLQGFNGIQRDMATLGFGVQHTLDNGFSSVNAGIAENRFAAQQCCCDTQRTIDSVRAENYRNTCDITNAIRMEGQATRALIEHNEMQNLRDKLADRDRDLQTANFQLSQQAQSANIIRTLRPYPIPAYQATSPYTAAYGVCGNCSGYCNA